MVISEKSSSTIDTCQMNIKIDTDKPVTLSINTTNEHHHLHTTSAPTSIYHSRNNSTTGPMNVNNTNPGHFHHHHTYLYNTTTGYNYSSTLPQTPSSASYYSMPQNNLYHDPYSQCSSYWKAAAVAAASSSSSSELSKTNNNHSSRFSYPIDHSQSTRMHYMPSSAGLSSQIDIKSEHSSPTKNTQLTMSATDDSNDSHQAGTEDDHEDEDEDVDLKTPEKEEANNMSTSAPRKSNRRAEKPPCKYYTIFPFYIHYFVNMASHF